MDASIKQSLAPITKFISKYHMTLFITFLGILLISALVLLLTLLTLSSSTEGATVATSNFDEKTAEQLDKLQDSKSNSQQSITFPANSRYNPFVE